MHQRFARRILVVEDDPFACALLAEVLRGHGFEVRIEHTSATARAAMVEFDPDAALLDIQLGDGPSGVALAHLLHRQYPHCALLFLTRFPDQHAAGLVDDEVPPGCGFLRKDQVGDAGYLVGALEQVLTDHGVDQRDDLDSDRPLAILTARQLAVLRLVAAGLTNEAIARERGISSSAVEQTLSAIIKSFKIPVRDEINPRVEIARRYIAAAGLPERQ